MESKKIILIIAIITALLITSCMPQETIIIKENNNEGTSITGNLTTNQCIYFQNSTSEYKICLENI